MVAAVFTAGHHARQLQSAQAQQTAMRERRAERDWDVTFVSSVMRTAEQQGRDVLETIKSLLRAEWAGKDIALLTDVL
jgi:hypothetical protein